MKRNVFQKRNVDYYLINAFIVSILFESYCFFSVGTYPVTIFTFLEIVTLFIQLFKLFGNKGKLFLKENQKIAVIFAFFVVVSTTITGLNNLTSPSRMMLNLVIYILFRYKEAEEKYMEHISFFINIMNVLSVYGIYQFVGRLKGWPFTDLVIPGHMVNGYNWTNYIYSFSTVAFKRSNAIFLEPSFFSQFLAISILLQIAIIVNNKKSFKEVFWLIINGIA